MEEKIFEEIEDMIYWAKEQCHISENAKDILLENLARIKEEYKVK